MLTESSEQAGGYSMQELEQSSKRRKTSAACTACKARKSRCELVTAAGCRRCCVLGTTCSFRVLSSFPENITEETRSSVENRASSTKDSSPSNELSTKANAMNQPRNAPSQQQASTSSAMAGRQGPAATTNSKTLEEMKKRTQRLELMMEMMLEDNMNNGNMSNPSSTSRQRLERHESLKVIPDEVTSADEKSAPDINYANWTGFLPLENILEPDMVRWAHPLESLGLEENWSRVCDVFKQEFTRILPLSHLRHPEFFENQCAFFQTSILLFTSRTTPGQHLFTNIQRRLINIVAERNISTATQVRPTEQRIIATLIMSNLPPNLPSDRLQPAEYQTAPLMALSMAQHLELDVALYLPYDAPFTGWPLADTEAVLEELCLWYSILHRVAWSNLHSSPTFRMSLPQGYLPLHLSSPHLHSTACNLPSISQWWRSLCKESEILEHVRLIAERFTAVKYARIYDQLQVEGFIFEFNAFADRMKDYRLQMEGNISLYLNCCAAQLGLYFRFAEAFAFKLPFALEPQCRQLNLKSSGRNLMQASQDIVKCIDSASTDYRSLPAFHVSIAILACGALLQTQSNQDEVATGDATEYLSKDSLVSACQKISCVHPTVAMVISRLQRPLGITAEIRDFVHAGPLAPDSTQGDDETSGPFNFSGTSSAQENIDIFAEWICPEADWLSSLLLAGSNDFSGPSGY